MTNPFKHLDKGDGYEKSGWCLYFTVTLDQSGGVARFKKNIITGTIYVFQSNQPTDNCWNETGYGWGIWRKL